MKHTWKYFAASLAILFGVAFFGTTGAGIPTVPGSTNLAVTQSTIQQTICVPGYTATIRPPSSYTTTIKINQLTGQRLGAIVDASKYEEDHAISLELGGNPTDLENLWPQPYEPRPGAREKDRVENYLHKEVCAGRMTLAEAQKEVLNWLPVYKQLSSGFGSVVGDAEDVDDI